MDVKVPVFYRPEQSCDAASSYSPSAGKPALVVADWLADPKIAPHIQIETFTPAGDEVLCGAHDPSYIEGVMTGEIDNGFRNANIDIAQSLRYTTGSLLAACKHVLTTRTPIACSPTSGFHHAGYDFGGGFCTFNGLMAAAIRVHALGLAKSILILDMDAHYGNGTQHIIEALGICYVHHVTADKSYRTAEQAMSISNMIYRLPSHSKKYDLVIYQAGADIHKDDPLGGLLTTEQMRQRDVNVFRGCVAHGIPCVWNLAGGYQRDEQGGIEPVLALHRETMRQCISMMEKA